MGGRKFLFKGVWGCGELTTDSAVTHYAYFGAFRSDVSNIGANAAMLTQNGELTDIGSWYMGGVATNNVPKTSNSTRSSTMWAVGVVGCLLLVQFLL
jgi:hypothetical protein